MKINFLKISDKILDRLNNLDDFKTMNKFIHVL